MAKVYKFLCQDCLAVVESDKWDKYHNEDNSCPVCKESEMCGCGECLLVIEERNLQINFIDKNDICFEILKVRGDFKLIKINENVYEIKENEELILQMECDIEAAAKQFENVGKGYVII